MLAAYFLLFIACRVLASLLVGGLFFNMQMNHLVIPDEDRKREIIEIAITVVIFMPFLVNMP